MRSPQLHTMCGAVSPAAPNCSAAVYEIAGTSNATVELVRPRRFSGVSWCGGTILCQRCPLRREGGSCPWWSGRGAVALCGFLPAAATKPGGTHAAGVQGSLSSCNIPHVKYEAKILLILHEEPGVNCVLPISSSRVLQSLCLHPLSSCKQRHFQILLLSSLP